MSTNLDQLQKHNWDNSLVAVSGGVDSIVLLDILASLNGKIEVAYIDHSQRQDTDQDIRAIKLLTDKYLLKLHTVKLELPQNCSEQQARTERYRALHNIKQAANLRHLITAHHADDVLETAVINLIRGTGPRGLSSLRHRQDGIWRPFLADFRNENYITKQDILKYANYKQLEWHEDSTNRSMNYLRNRIRKKLEHTKPEYKMKLLEIISKNITLVEQIDDLTNQLDPYLRDQNKKNSFSIQKLKKLPKEIKDQFLHQKISSYGYDVNRDSVERAKSFIESKSPGKILHLKGCQVTILKGGLFQFASTKK